MYEKLVTMHRLISDGIPNIISDDRKGGTIPGVGSPLPPGVSQEEKAKIDKMLGK
jgi:hypothetical protein